MTLKCECGGTLRQVEIGNFDFSPFAGLPVELRDVPGLRCDVCGYQTLDGEVINHVLHSLTQEVLVLPRILSPDEAKYLRRHLELAPKDLAKKMHLRREVVEAWERGENPPSPRNDLLLRTLVIGNRQPESPYAFSEEITHRALGQMRASVKTPPQSERYIFSEQLKFLRGMRALLRVATLPAEETKSATTPKNDTVYSAAVEHIPVDSPSDKIFLAARPDRNMTFSYSSGEAVLLSMLGGSSPEEPGKSSTAEELTTRVPDVLHGSGHGSPGFHGHVKASSSGSVVLGTLRSLAGFYLASKWGFGEDHERGRTRAGRFVPNASTPASSRKHDVHYYNVATGKPGWIRRGAEADDQPRQNDNVETTLFEDLPIASHDKEAR